MGNLDSHRPQSGNCARPEDDRNSSGDGRGKYKVAVESHKAEVLVALFHRNRIKCPRRLLLCKYCMVLYGTSRDKCDCHTSGDAHKS